MIRLIRGNIWNLIPFFCTVVDCNLLKNEHLMVEKLLQLFVGKVNAQLFIGVFLKINSYKEYSLVQE